MEYRMRRTLPDDRVAIIMPVDHGLIFSRLPGLESPAKVIEYWAKQDVTGFMLSPGQVKQTASPTGSAKSSPPVTIGRSRSSWSRC